MAYPTTINFQPTSQMIGTQPINATSTTQNHPLGTIVKAKDATLGEGEFIYLKGVASTVKGDLVAYDIKAATTTRAVHSGATSVGPAAVAMSDNVASQYGWYAISGAVPVAAGTVLANKRVYMTGTAGTIDDAVVATDGLDGAFTTSADSAGFAYVLLDRPGINGNG